MRPFSFCLSLLSLSTCLSATPNSSPKNTNDFATLMASFQGKDFKQRLIHKEYLFQKYKSATLSDFLAQQNIDYPITQLDQCEETIALGKPANQFKSSQLSNIIHSAGLTHLESFISHPKNKPFLSTKSPAYQDAFYAEFLALCDVSRVFSAEEWIPFRLRVDTELIKSPREHGQANTFYADICKQAKNRLINQNLKTLCSKQH